MTNNELQQIIKKLSIFSTKQKKQTNSSEEINQAIRKIRTTSTKNNNFPIIIHEIIIEMLIKQLQFINQISLKRSEQTRQSRQPFIPRQNSASFKNSFQSQNAMHTQSYQLNQLQNEISLPFYEQQYEITKTQLIISNSYCSRIAQNDCGSMPYGWIIYIFK